MSQDSLVATATAFTSRESPPPRPRVPQSSRSFPRLEPSSNPGSPPRTRASTLQSDSRSGTLNTETITTVPDNEKSTLEGDVFDRTTEDEVTEAENTPTGPSGSVPESFDDLPIELVSLTDRFIDSLSAKVHPTPPTVDKLSELFQDFYVLAATHISTHISTLSSRQHRSSSPHASASSRSPSATKGSGKASPANSKAKSRFTVERSSSEQQMLTTAEIDDRRKARKLLEKKRLALEEAVERKACEGVYDRIWRHRSTHDEERDEKLRSRTAALAVVGIGLDELGIEVKSELPDGSPVKESDVRDWLSGARDGLMKMNDERYPLGKLHHLKDAHKAIVDTLSQIHPASSSADEILPTMIYTLITTPHEGINIISNLYFIQRFRAESKIDGEAAYCLTNLEAAITFLETVDLTSLRASEAPSGPPKATSQPSTPQADRLDPFNAKNVAVPTPLSPVQDASPTTPVGVVGSSIPKSASMAPIPRPTSSASSHQRRLSQLLQPPTNALGAASDVVINKADQSLKTIGYTLENSYKLLFGRLNERQYSGAGLDNEGKVVVPKTLDEARKLVGTPPPVEDDGTASIASSGALDQADPHRDELRTKKDDKLMGLIGGLSMTRERSSDSTRSGTSGRKVGFAEDSASTGDTEGHSTTSRLSVTSHPAMSSPASSINPAMESMRNLGNTLNPLNHFGGINVMRSFGRGGSATSTPPVSSTPVQKARDDELSGAGLGGVADLTTAFPDLAAVLPPKEVVKVAPPIRKFMEVENPGDLKISDVLELLRDYRRLAGALKDFGAC